MREHFCTFSQPSTRQRPTSYCKESFSGDPIDEVLEDLEKEPMADDRTFLRPDLAAMAILAA
ncbi:hypothetical protein ACWIEX_11200 [Bosea sp. NPDC055353]